VFSSLAAFAPAFHGGFPFLLPLFIVGHVIWFVIIVLIIVFAVTGRRRRMARWAAMGGAQGAGQFGGWGHGPWGHGWGNSAAKSAESTLAERFAQGDIDEKEYRARLEVLRANNSGPQQPTA
jgi:putative membrane protein